MSTIRRAVLVGFYGAGNLGDELMLHALSRWLEAQGVATTVVSERPETTARDHGLDAVANVPLTPLWGVRSTWLRGGGPRLIEAFRQADLVAIGGGDLLRDDRGFAQFAYTAEKLALAHALGKPVYLLNTGVGRPCTAYGRFAYRRLLPRCRFVVGRDARTAEVCAQAGVAAGRVALAPDIVNFIGDFLDSPPAPPPGEPAHALVCLRDAPNSYGQYRLDPARIGNLARALDRFAAHTGLELRFLPFRRSKRESDERLHDAVLAGMATAGRARRLEWSCDPRLAAERFAGASFVLAMRLHAGILANAFRKPFALMPYDHKVGEFAGQYGIRARLTAETLDDAEAAGRLLAEAYEAGYSGELRPGWASWQDLRLEGAGGGAAAGG